MAIAVKAETASSESQPSLFGARGSLSRPVSAGRSEPTLVQEIRVKFCAFSVALAIAPKTFGLSGFLKISINDPLPVFYSNRERLAPRRPDVCAPAHMLFQRLDSCGPALRRRPGRRALSEERVIYRRSVTLESNLSIAPVSPFGRLQPNQIALRQNL